MKISFPHERLEKRWWRDWWSEDFSWQALERKPVGRFQHALRGGLHAEKTLMEYWRRDLVRGHSRTDNELLDSGELIRDPHGKLWHLAHVPLHWRDGSAGKAAWDVTQRDQLSALIRARVRVTERSSFLNFAGPTAPDGRAQLQGAVLTSPPSELQGNPSSLRLNCDFAWLPTWDASGETFGEGASFRKALFHGCVQWQRASFEKGACFEEARFLADATFGTGAESAAVRFHELADFRRAIFLGKAIFDRCWFTAARFDQSHFAGPVTFFAARFDKSSAFDGSTFEAPVSFRSSNVAECLGFGTVRARSTVDLGSVSWLSGAHLSFRNSLFEDVVTFGGARFPRRAANISSAFAGTRFVRAPDFASTGRFWISALDRVVLEQGLLLDEAPSAYTEREFMKRVLPEALAEPPDYENPKKIMREQVLALEGGCRAIRQAAARFGESELERLYARLEGLVHEELERLPVLPLEEVPPEPRFDW